MRIDLPDTRRGGNRSEGDRKLLLEQLRTLFPMRPKHRARECEERIREWCGRLYPPRRARNLLKIASAGLVKPWDACSRLRPALPQIATHYRWTEPANIRPNIRHQRRRDWWRPMQFFYGPADSGTSLHFDSFGTHGYLFQITGRKQIIFIDQRDRARCHMTRFFWSAVDAEAPDLARWPDFAGVQRWRWISRPGDLVYWPPWTLHQVRNLEAASSFSLEWHDRTSVVKSFMRLHNPTASRMLRPNLPHLAGLWLGIPPRLLYPFYRFYFDKPGKRPTA
jgi:hypothetical protein